MSAHVVVEPLVSDELEDGAVFETMSDLSDIEIDIGDEPLVVPDYGLPAGIVSTDLDACGSIVHVIDTVLIPDSQVLVALEIPDPIIADYESR